MKDYFLVRFSPFMMVTPAKPDSQWLDFITQCQELAQEFGPGTYWIDNESASGIPFKFSI